MALSPLWQLILTAFGAAVLTSGLTLLLSVWQFRREDRARFLADKRLNYAKVIALADEYWDIRSTLVDTEHAIDASRFEVRQGQERQGSESEAPRTLVAATERLEASVADLHRRVARQGKNLSEALSVTYILAPSAVSERATELLRAARAGSSSETFGAALQRFVDAARVDLGIKDARVTPKTGSITSR
jgi:hypothetical protein